MQEERSSSAAKAWVWYYAPYSATARRPGVEMMSDILLQPVTVSTERSTDQPCGRDMCNTARIFTHKSNTCVIRKLAFLNLGFVDLLTCTSSPPPSTTSHQSQRSGTVTVSWVLRDWSGAEHPLIVWAIDQVGYSNPKTQKKQWKKLGVRHPRNKDIQLRPVIKLGMRHLRKQERKN